MSSISAIGLLFSTFFIRAFSMPVAVDTTELITRSAEPTTSEMRAIELAQRTEKEPDWDYGRREAQAEDKPEWDYGRHEAQAEEGTEWDYGKREAEADAEVELTIRAPEGSVVDTSDTNMKDFTGKHQVYNDKVGGGCSVM